MDRKMGIGSKVKLEEVESRGKEEEVPRIEVEEGGTIERSCRVRRVSDPMAVPPIVASQPRYLPSDPAPSSSRRGTTGLANEVHRRGLPDPGRTGSPSAALLAPRRTPIEHGQVAGREQLSSLLPRPIDLASPDLSFRR